MLGWASARGSVWARCFSALIHSSCHGQAAPPASGRLTKGECSCCCSASLFRSYEDMKHKAKIKKRYRLLLSSSSRKLLIVFLCMVNEGVNALGRQ